MFKKFLCRTVKYSEKKIIALYPVHHSEIDKHILTTKRLHEEKTSVPRLVFILSPGGESWVLELHIYVEF